MKKNSECFKRTVSSSNCKFLRSRHSGSRFWPLLHGLERYLESMKYLSVVLTIGIAASVSAQTQCASLASAVPSCGVRITDNFHLVLRLTLLPATMRYIRSLGGWLRIHKLCVSMQFLRCQCYVDPGRIVRPLRVWSYNRPSG